MPGTFKRTQERRQPRNIGKRIAENADSDRISTAYVERHNETCNCVATAAHECARVRNELSIHGNTLGLESPKQIGRREQRNGARRAAQSLQTSEGEISGIARTQTNDSNQHCDAECSLYDKGAHSGAFASGVVPGAYCEPAGAFPAGPGDGKASAKR